MKVDGSATQYILVGSGKGGVGKTTLVTRLAQALHRAGVSVGLVDADLANPSLHRVLEVDKRSEDGLLLSTCEGIPLLSPAIEEQRQAGLVMRPADGSNLVLDLFDMAEWPPLNVILVDLPGGASELHVGLSLAFRPGEGILISTPDPLSVSGVRALATVWRRLDQQVSHLFLNLAYHECPHCGHRHSTESVTESAIHNVLGRKASATIGFYDEPGWAVAVGIVVDMIVDRL